MLLCNSTNMSSRIYKYSSTNHNEMYKFFSLLLLISQNQKPTLHCSFSNNPLYYQPIFSNIMSGRRLEVLLRSFSCECLPTAQPLKPNRFSKIQPVLDMFLRNCQSIFYPPEQFSLDESLLLHRGWLVFRQYIPNKKAKYGIKFYELCSYDGYVLNIEIYSGKHTEEETSGDTKTNKLVKRLTGSYLNTGHHLYMDNF